MESRQGEHGGVTVAPLTPPFCSQVGSVGRVQPFFEPVHSQNHNHGHPSTFTSADVYPRTLASSTFPALSMKLHRTQEGD